MTCRGLVKKNAKLWVRPTDVGGTSAGISQKIVAKTTDLTHGDFPEFCAAQDWLRRRSDSAPAGAARMADRTGSKEVQSFGPTSRFRKPGVRRKRKVKTGRTGQERTGRSCGILGTGYRV